jgi:hypothetical protein
MKKQITYLLIVTIFAASFYGCAANNSSLSYLNEYKGAVYKPKEIYNYGKEEVFNAVINSMKERGFDITVSDSRIGLLIAEFNSVCPLPEEMAEYDKYQSQVTCANILGIVLVFGLIIIIVKALSTNTPPPASLTASYSDDYSSEEKDTYIKYRFNFLVSALNDNKTEVSLEVTKSVIENGTAKSQTKLVNQFFNNDIFKQIGTVLTGGYPNDIQINDTLQTKAN